MSQLNKCRNSKILGVCCGLSKWIGIDVSLIRLFFLLGTIFTGTVLLWIYLLLAIVLSFDNENAGDSKKTD
jgi:phage shock protein PspC (stress-responsive transcriptional regulator)